MLSCLCLLDAIVKLHVMIEKLFNDFLIGRWKWDCICNWFYLIQVLYGVYVVEAFITLHWKAYYKYMSSFSSLPLVRIHLSFSINFAYIYRGFNLIATHKHLGFQWRVHPPGSWNPSFPSLSILYQFIWHVCTLHPINQQTIGHILGWGMPT